MPVLLIFYFNWLSCQMHKRARKLCQKLAGIGDTGKKIGYYGYK